MKNRILDRIKEIIQKLDELDNWIEELPNSQSQVDSLLSDYRHLLKENVFDEKSAYKVALKIKETELLRAEIKQDLDISNAYNVYKNRLSSKENRQFIVSELHKKTKDWNQPYKYRILTEKDVTELLSEEKKKRGRPKKEEKVDK